MQSCKSKVLNKSQDGPWLGKVPSEGEFKNVTRKSFLHVFFFFEKGNIILTLYNFT